MKFVTTHVKLPAILLLLAAVVFCAHAKTLLLDMDQAILHRAAGIVDDEAGVQSNSANQFKTLEEAIIMKEYYEENGYKGLCFVTSRLPIGLDQFSDDDRENHLMVVVRPDIPQLLRDARKYGWKLAINTAMNPVHGQQVAEGMLHLVFDVYGDEGEVIERCDPEHIIPQRHRWYRCATRRFQTTVAGQKNTNFKDLSHPTWTIRVAQSDEGIGQFEYFDGEEWRAVSVNTEECNDSFVADNYFATYMADENDSQQLKWPEDCANRPGRWNKWNTMTECGERINLIKNIEEMPKRTIREWLNEHSIMIMFDDKPYMIGGCKAFGGTTYPEKRPVSERFGKHDASILSGKAVGPTVQFGNIPWYPRIGVLIIAGGQVVKASINEKYPGAENELAQIRELRAVMRLPDVVTCSCRPETQHQKMVRRITGEKLGGAEASLEV